jgi:transcriptional regulator of arginine metabolism
MKPERRRDLLRILQEGRAHSQQDIVSFLRAAGHDATQATVSRDLRDIGAAKVKIGDAFVYRLPEQLPRSQSGDLMARSLASTLEEFAIDIKPAASLVVVKTAPGHAGAVARAIDLSGDAYVIGTVAGDDTILIATPDPSSAERLVGRWLQGASTALRAAP